MHFHMSSFNEAVALGCLKQAPIEFVKYPFIERSFLQKLAFYHHVVCNLSGLWPNGVKNA